MGDCLGYWLGRHFGQTLIRWARTLLRLEDDDLQAARRLIASHGGRTIFIARFIFGLRTIAGPMAGSLGMQWVRFFKFNMLRASVWVTALAFVGYAFASEFQSLLGYIEKASWGISGALFLAGYLYLAATEEPV